MRLKHATLVAILISTVVFGAFAQVDAVSSASTVSNNADFLKAISKNGSWIVITTKSLTFNQDVVLDGNFLHRGAYARTLAFYASDSKHNVTAVYTVAAPRFIVKSENTQLEGGIIKGDVYVQSNNFTLAGTIEGNLYFANAQCRATFKITGSGKVTGTIAVKPLGN